MNQSPLALDHEQLLLEASKLRRLARRLVRGEAEAEDLVQETWLAALREQPDLRYGLGPWLAHVLRNFARARRRGEAHRSRREELAARPERQPPAVETVERLEAQRRLVEALQALAEPYRTTVTQRYLEGLSAAQIARRAGVPAGTVRWRLKQGMDELRARLQARSGGERQGWVLGLLPLLQRSPQVGLGAAGAAGVLQGVFFMNTMARVGIAAAVLVSAAIGVWVLAQPEASELGSREARAAQAPPAVLDASPSEEPLHDLAQDPAAQRGELAPSVASQPAPAVAATQARLEARFLDASAHPLRGVHVTLQGARAESGADGRVGLDIELDGETAKVGLEAVLPGRESAFRTVHLDRGRTTWLGDVVLGPGGGFEGLVLGPDGSPFAGAEIVVAPPDVFGDLEDARRRGPERDACPHGRSTASGSFRIEGVAADKPVRVWAGAPDMRWTASAPLEIHPSELRPGLELRLEALTADDRIEGIVLGPDGTPLPDVYVRFAYRSQGSSGSSGLRTGPDGRFRLKLYRKGAHDFHVRDPQRRWPNVSAFEVQPGTLDLVLRFAEPRWMELVVREPDGAPIERYGVALASADGGRQIDLLEEDDRAQGRLRLALPGEPFRMTVRAHGHERAQIGPLDPATLPASYEGRLARQPGLRGRVTAQGQPISGATVELLRLAEKGTTIEHNGFPSRVYPDAKDSVTSAADGSFVLDASEAGACAILCNASGYALAELSPLLVEPRTGAQGLELALVPGGAIEGRVIAPPGKDPTGTIVAIDRYDARPRTQRVGPDGKFSFAQLTPGRWRVKRAIQEVRDGDSGTGVSSSGLEQAFPWDCVVEDGRTTRHDLDLSDERPCLLAGQVSVNGRPAHGWSATLWPESNVSTVELPTGAVDEQGRLRLEIPEPGRYNLALRVSGEGGSVSTFNTLLTLRRGENPWTLDLRTGELRGQRAAAGEAGRLRYTWSDQAGLSFTTRIEPDASGHFELPLVPAGRGTLSRLVQAEGRAWRTAGERTVDVPAGGTVEVEAP